MTTLGDSVRTKVTGAITRIGTAMTLNTGAFGDFDYRNQRAVGTTVTAYTVTGVLYRSKKDRDESQTIQRATVVLGAEQLTTLGATLDKGQTIVSGSETWTIDEIVEPRPDAAAAAFFLSVSRGA